MLRPLTCVKLVGALMALLPGNGPILAEAGVGAVATQAQVPCFKR